MNIRGFLISSLVLVGAFAPTVTAQGKDELWEVTSTMEMPGMPMAMPGQTNRVCVGKNRRDDELIPRQGDCRMVDGKRVGDKFTYTMDCAGNNPSTVSGEVRFGGNAYDGKMRMTMKQTNDTMEMKFSGKRVGDCTAPAK
jgi:hypothetical protein